MVCITIASTTAEARQIQEEIEKALQEMPTCSERDLFSIKLALEEALVNAIKHGNQMNPNKCVRIEYAVTEAQFEVRVSDDGIGFDPADVPDPTAIENLDRPCGRGLMLMRHYMTDVYYNEDGNCVSMSKRFQLEDSK